MEAEKLANPKSGKKKKNKQNSQGKEKAQIK